MKWTGPHSFLMASFFTTGLLLMGCSGEYFSIPQSNHDQADVPFTQFVEKSLGTDWFGIYIQGSKVGYLKSASGREVGQNDQTYKIQLSGTILIPSQVEADEMKILVDAVFSARPPFSMISFSDRLVHKNDIAETEITRTSKGYKARVTQGNETRAYIIGPFAYTLKDYTALQRWIIQDPPKGATIKYPFLNLKTLTLEEKTSRILEIRETIVSGIKTSYYDVVSTSFDGLEIHEKFGTDGRPYRIVLGGMFECRLEPQSMAINIDKTSNLFLKNTVPINRELGITEKVAKLIVSLNHISGDLIDNAPGQSVTHSPADNSLIVTIDSRGVPYITATKEEIKKNLAATIDIPSTHPSIVGLARSAVGDAGADSEKLGRLVKFVYEYIEDDYTANPLTVLDIIKRKKGDCSEHARLFTAMARAVGISCRTVGGLVYLGDEFQEFGLHAWNEVVIDGMWVPVDPTWGQTLVDATHIRFPTDITDEWQIMAAIPDMKMKVLYVEYNK